jgi:hypothetical protein
MAAVALRACLILHARREHSLRHSCEHTICAAFGLHRSSLECLCLRQLTPGMRQVQPHTGYEPAACCDVKENQAADVCCSESQLARCDRRPRRSGTQGRPRAQAGWRVSPSSRRPTRAASCWTSASSTAASCGHGRASSRYMCACATPARRLLGRRPARCRSRWHRRPCAASSSRAARSCACRWRWTSSPRPRGAPRTPAGRGPNALPLALCASLLTVCAARLAQASPPRGRTKPRSHGGARCRRQPSRRGRGLDSGGAARHPPLPRRAA